MKKHIRHLARIPGVEEIRRKSSGHLHLLDSSGRRLAVASSTPRNPDHAIRNAERDVARSLRSGQ